MENIKELNDKAVAVVSKLLDALDSGIDSAPGVIQELSNEYITMMTLDAINIPVILITCVMFMLVLFLGYFWFKWRKEECVGLLINTICSGIICIISFGVSLDSLWKAYKINKTPKAHLIEKLRGKK